MDLSTILFTTGFVISGIGFGLVLLSLKASSDELKRKATGIIFVGPIPLIFGGDRRFVTLLLVTAILIFIFIISVYQPNLIGW
jgi:uncharacterized protein (TIGR00304 family)